MMAKVNRKENLCNVKENNAKIGRKMQYATIVHCPYPYKERGICEISAFDLTNCDNITDFPRWITNEE